MCSWWSSSNWRLSLYKNTLLLDRITIHSESHERTALEKTEREREIPTVWYIGLKIVFSTAHYHRLCTAPMPTEFSVMSPLPASRPCSYYYTYTHGRRGSNARRASADGDRPLSAPPTKPAVPKQRPRSSLGERNDVGGKPTKSRRRSYVSQPVSQPALECMPNHHPLLVDVFVAFTGL